MSVTFQTREITPMEAEALVAKVKHPSAPNRKQVSAYAEDMAKSRWKLNGEPIVISDSGLVLSGRLRLLACIKAQRAFPAVIVSGISEHEFETIDSLRKRTVSDILGIRNEPHGRALAAALALLWRFSQNDQYKASLKVPTQAILAILEQHPDLRQSVISARAVTPALPLGMGAALHYMFSLVSPEKTTIFFNDLKNSLESGGDQHNAALLARQLQSDYQSGGRRNPFMMQALTIKAWNAFASGKTLGQLRWSENESPPQIENLPKNLSLDGTAIVRDTIERAQEGDIAAVRVRLLQLTPTQANELLEKNDGNRRISQSVVDKYARDIREGNWRMNGQTIKIGVTGRLLDGQHRCAAVLKAERPIQTLIVENLQDSVFDTFDLGQNRGLAEILKERGEQNTSTLAAAIRQIWLFSTGHIQHRVVAPTNSEMLELLEKHPGIRRSVSIAHRIRDVIPTSVGCALHYIFSTINRGKAQHFFDSLGTGADLSSESPILKLRNLLLRNRNSNRRSLSVSETYAITIKSWNAFVTGAPMKKLAWQNSGKREEFPMIAGYEYSTFAESEDAT